MKKKIVKIFKDNVVGLIFGIVFALSIGVIYAATNYNSTDVSYTMPSGGRISASTVKGALDQLFSKISDNGVVHYAFGNPTTSSPIDYGTIVAQGHNVFAALYPDGSKALCLVKNGKIGCFKGGTSNWASNRYLIQAFFSEVSCPINNSTSVGCDTDLFSCYVRADGAVNCSDYDTGEFCDISVSGSVSC